MMKYILVLVFKHLKIKDIVIFMPKAYSEIQLKRITVSILTYKKNLVNFMESD